MDFASSFLLASGIAYYCAIVLPQPSVKNNISRNFERLWMSLIGTIIILLVLLSKLRIFNAWWCWAILGIFYVMAAMLSYLGYTKWNVLWRNDVSDEAQMCMWLWDLGIAVSAFIMI